jgi:YD repeat-containing protein
MNYLAGVVLYLGYHEHRRAMHMTDREKAGLRGPVQKIVSDTYMADWKSKTMPEKPNFREEIVYLPDGRLLSMGHHNPDGSTGKTSYTYDANSRLFEVRSSSGHEDYISRYSYDQQGRLIRVTNSKGDAAEFTAEAYQYASDGVKTRIWFIPPKPMGQMSGLTCASRAPSWVFQRKERRL